MEQNEKQGRKIYCIALTYCITIAVLVATAYLSIIILKNHYISTNSLDFKRALLTDCIQLFVYLILTITLTGTLVYFRVLESRHEMKIRKRYVFMTFFFGFLTFLISLFRTVSNDMVQKLIYQSDIEPLPSYPASKLTVVNVLRSVTCVMSMTVYMIVSFLMYNIGIKQISSREESVQFATQ